MSLNQTGITSRLDVRGYHICLEGEPGSQEALMLLLPSWEVFFPDSEAVAKEIFDVTFTVQFGLYGESFVKVCRDSCLNGTYTGCFLFLLMGTNGAGCSQFINHHLFSS